MQPIDIDANRTKIIELLESTKREGMDKLICKLKSTDFFTAPASINYHLNRPGGLAQHSINVCETLRLLSEKIHTIPIDSIIIASLLHDVCKIGMYIATNTGYIYNKNQPKGHGALSVKRVSFFIELSPLEEKMIRWHMNKYEEGFEKSETVLKKAFPEVFLIYFADHMSSLFLED